MLQVCQGVIGLLITQEDSKYYGTFIESLLLILLRTTSVFDLTLSLSSIVAGNFSTKNLEQERSV